MPKYKYSAVSETGEQATGEYTAADETAVTGMLRQGGYYPTQIKLIALDEERVRKRIPVKVLSGYCAQMATLLRAGVPISRALEILTAQQEHPAFRKLLEDVYSSVLRGVSLSDAFRPYEKSLPALLVNMMEAGETSGTLDDCMERAGDSFSRLAKLNSKVKGAMIYPAIIMTVMFGLIILMLTVVLPQFSEMYADSGADLPGFTQFLLNISDALIRYWYLFLGVTVAIVVGSKAWLSSESGKLAFDKFKMEVPMVRKLLPKIYAARFARTLASLSSTGVPLTQSLAVTARSILNSVIEKDLYEAIEGINRGELLSTQLERMKAFPLMIVYMVKIGEETGTMDDLLNQAADYYDDESENAIQALTSMLEPLLIVLMAIIIVPILIGVLLPMFGMHDMIM